jgi:hypothetical protein
MDFKKLIQKIESIDGKIKTPSAPVIPSAMTLTEDAQLRVLSGRTSYVAEAKKEKETKEAFDANAQPGDTYQTKTGVATKTKTGMRHNRTKGLYDPGSDDKDDKKVKRDAKKTAAKEPATTESFNTDAFDLKFSRMVEAKKNDDKKEPTAKAAKKANTKAQAKTSFDNMLGNPLKALGDLKVREVSDKDSDSEDRTDESSVYDFDKPERKNHSTESMPSKAHIAKMCKDGKTTAEICKMHPDCDQSKLKEMIKDCKSMQVKEGAKPDFLDVDKDGDKKEPMKKAAADKKKGAAPKKGVNPFAKKKSTVKESVDRKLSFKEMISIVEASGGQQQIDPIDKALFTWAQRVASQKFNESTKSEVYAGLIYERNGGRFEMYDVLRETKK